MSRTIPKTGEHIVREVKKVMHCLKCGHAWERRNEERLPKVCSKCVHPACTVSGVWRAIESAEYGEQAIGMLGDPTDIEDVMEHTFAGHLIKITPSGCLPFSVTPDHKIPIVTCRINGDRQRKFSAQQYIKAGDLTGTYVRGGWAGEQQYLLMPIIAGRSVESGINLSDFTSKHGMAVTEGKNYPTQYPISDNAAWLLGLFAAEGSTSTSETRFHLGSHETDLIEKCCAVITELGYKPDIDVAGSVTSVSLPSRLLTRAFRFWLGSDCYSKRVPDFIFWNSSKAVVKSFLQGYFDGDGSLSVSRNRQPKSQASTVSRVLALQIQLLGARLGMQINISTYDYSKHSSTLADGRVISGGVAYMIRSSSPELLKLLFGLDREPPKNPRWIIRDEAILVPVRKLELEHYEGPVRNLQTTDGNYLVHNIAVKNCKNPNWWLPKIFGRGRPKLRSVSE